VGGSAERRERVRRNRPQRDVDQDRWQVNRFVLWHRFPHQVPMAPCLDTCQHLERESLILCQALVGKPARDRYKFWEGVREEDIVKEQQERGGEAKVGRCGKGPQWPQCSRQGPPGQLRCDERYPSNHLASSDSHEAVGPTLPLSQIVFGTLLNLFLIDSPIWK
jgi:hypothetical protein